MKNKKKKDNRTYIGGQAVLEGVMMRGKTAYATAVRDPEGNIQVESRRINASPKMRTVSKIPLVRGVVNFVVSLVTGSKILMRSAEVYGDEGEPSKFEKWCAAKLHVNIMSVVTTIATIFGILLSIGLFVALPIFLTDLLVKTGTWLERHGIWYNLIQGGIRLVIFLLYIVAITAMRDMRRVFMYHGAEHKTITCFESGKELTPQNAKTCSRLHDRCGTTFLFLVMAVSILVFSIVNWVCKTYLNFYRFNDAINFLIQFGVKILFLPLVAGLSYEILKLLAKSQSKWLLPFKAPGFALQKLTTREPSEDMLEVAIAAFKTVYDMDADASIPETDFVVSKSVRKYTEELKTLFAENGIDESDAEWLVSIKLGLKRSELMQSNMILVPGKVRELDALVAERLSGRPLWYIIGDTDFYGNTIKVDERVLIPRPETELMVEQILKIAQPNSKILDLCTGSGCIAIALAKEGKDKELLLTASDISEGALALAAENATANEVAVDFIHSDLLNDIKGKFDIIVCNPPYIKTEDILSLQKEVRDFEPKTALDGGEDGLDFYRRLAQEAPKHLVSGGTLIMECGIGQAQEIVKLFDKFDYTMVMRDDNDIERFVRAVL